jgi:hypothetical protein
MPATAVETAASTAHRATAESTATAEPVHRSAAESTAYGSASAIIPTGSVVSASSVVSPTSVVSTTAVITAVPRPCADEDAAGKPARTIVTIRSARVRVIVVVAVSASRCGTHIRRSANPHADRKSLRMRVTCWNQTQTKHRENSHVFHLRTPSDSLKSLP